MSWNHLKTSSPEEVVEGVSGSKHAAKTSDGDLESLEIMPSDNSGFTVTHRMKSKGKEEPFERESKKNVFADHESMMAHVHKMTAPKNKK
jgi:hypothetical protein